MRRLRYLSLFLFFLIGLQPFQTYAYGADLEKKAAAHELYDRLSENEVANHFVWAEGTIQEIQSNWIAQGLIGGVILEKPSNKIDFPAHIAVALHLDESLMISENQSSQVSAQTLFAVENSAVRTQYIDWLRQEAKSLGYDHLILPEAQAVNLDLAPLFEEIQRFDTTFFIRHASLQRQVDSRRKKFYESNLSQEVKVIPTDQFEQFEKTLSKGPKKAIDSQAEVLNHLQALLATDNTPKREAKATESLLTKLWKQAVVPVQLQPGVQNT